MGLAPLAIIQAHRQSSRLPDKMLLDLGGHPVLWWGWSAAVQVFGRPNVIIATLTHDVGAFYAALPEARIFGWEGPEWDVLGRVHACAHWNWPDGNGAAVASLVYRITPDDWPIDPFRESCTLAQLDTWNATVTDPHTREHIGLLFPGRLEINTLEDLEKARARVESDAVR